MKDFLDQKLKEFNQSFQKDFKSKIPLLDIVLNYVVKSKGKQMRPRFVMNTAALFGNINEQTFAAASLIELLHTATLVHDDIVDDANRRRGLFSVNALWKNKIAVLVGDYLLSKGMINALEGKHFELLLIVSNAVKAMSEGELLQIEKARKLDIDESVYFEIIQNKTASLLASACAAGAYSTSQDIQIKDKMWEFGSLVGIAFQIKDDLLDYGKNDIGKPLGIDIKEKKMTLPLIYTLKHCDNKIKKDIIYKIKNKNTEQASIDFIINEVQKSGGLAFAQKQMESHIEQAINILKKLPETEARTELQKLVMSTINRKK